ncbi:tetratricopeptide repeat protein [bacterium]|nr:tetratricopeptide repeat protein [candidate division CSSED10-310 bacterium]
MRVFKWSYRRLVLVMTCFVATGCVSTDLVQKMVKDIDDMKERNVALQAEVDGLKERVDALETRDGLSAETGIGTGDEASDASGGSGETTVSVIDRPAGESAGEAEGILEGAREGEGAAGPDRHGGGVSAEEMYTRAQALYTEQRYREAARAFAQAELLDDAPEFQARCGYWYGESMYAQGAFEKALDAFGKVFVKYGTTAKAPDALLKIGFTYYEMRNYNGSRQALNEFIARFPDHRAVPLAQERLRWIDHLESGDSPSDR